MPTNAYANVPAIAGLEQVAHSGWWLEHLSGKEHVYTILPDGRRDIVACWCLAKKTVDFVISSPPTIKTLQVTVAGTKCYAGMRLQSLALQALHLQDDTILCTHLGNAIGQMCQTLIKVDGGALSQCLQHALAACVDGQKANQIAQLRAQIWAKQDVLPKVQSANARRSQRLLVRGKEVPKREADSLLRLEAALHLLLEGRATMAEVADACGYADASHMGRQIRAKTGYTPKALLQKLSQTFHTPGIF